MSTNRPEELSPAAPGSPLADLRQKLLESNKSAVDKSLARDYVDVKIDRLTVPGAFSVWARYTLPELSHINRLQVELGKQNKGGPAAILSVYIHFLLQQCVGVFMVPDDDPDLSLGLALDVPPDKATDPATWPTFKDGWKDVAKAFQMDMTVVTNPGRMVKAIYGDGHIVSTVDHVLHAAGYDQGN